MCSKCGHNRCRLISSSKTTSSSSKSTPSSSKATSSSSKTPSSSARRSSSGQRSDSSKSSVKTASSGLSQLSTLAQTISEDLQQASEALETLVHNWDIDNENLQNYIPDYKPSRWTKAMREKNDQYHDYDKQRKRHMKEFRDHFKANCSVDPTAKDFNKLRVLAVKWADDAVTVAEARLQFLMENQNAYKDHQAVKGHLDQIQNMINSAKNALARQKQTKASIQNIQA
ncbi:hypothetical protein BOTCAL_0788g00020 [Botryotinia calthae]|uniref:Uncharacterized protein n=1 Tax=Botryotinia calthae TaxID=38488 RepID=A0A4Y8CGX3_9HELO|nr:hypothetical protein BOTCAL_0788g00020 [Botryotinia calthae]